MCEEAKLTGIPAKKAKIGKFEYLDQMDEHELTQVLLGILPIVKLEDKQDKNPD